jgi:hypothetical protein
MAHWLSMISPLNVLPFGAAKLKLHRRTAAKNGNRWRFTGLPPHVWIFELQLGFQSLCTMRGGQKGYGRAANYRRVLSECCVFVVISFQ